MISLKPASALALLWTYALVWATIKARLVSKNPPPSIPSCTLLCLKEKSLLLLSALIQANLYTPLLFSPLPGILCTSPVYLKILNHFKLLFVAYLSHGPALKTPSFSSLVLEQWPASVLVYLAEELQIQYTCAIFD
jgi:hypothetical protein